MLLLLWWLEYDHLITASNIISTLLLSFTLNIIIIIVIINLCFTLVLGIELQKKKKRKKRRRGRSVELTDCQKNTMSVHIVLQVIKYLPWKQHLFVFICDTNMTER